MAGYRSRARCRGTPLYIGDPNLTLEWILAEEVTVLRKY